MLLQVVGRLRLQLHLLLYLHPLLLPQQAPVLQGVLAVCRAELAAAVALLLLLLPPAVL
jgi:hypothetical protein